jgi:hypothetical protein
MALSCLTALVREPDIGDAVGDDVEPEDLSGKERQSHPEDEAPQNEAIEQFWAAPANQADASWRDHRDINEVMYATSLAPLGYLGRTVARGG